MSAKPVLVLQMQRMGDLILSFPLFLWLMRRFPDSPVWVAAEEAFFRPLMPVSPRVVYFPWSGADVLKRHEYAMVLNLSVQPRAAELAGLLRAEAKLGPVRDAGGAVRVLGQWQLYRQSLVHNNRHNRFHWADLNALDVVPLEAVRSTRFDPPRRLSAESNKIGLFLGASEEAKRPGAAFWAELTRALLDRDLRPVLLGGPAETALGKEVARRFGGPVLNLCGRMKLNEFAAAGQTLQLMVTPDTGPMHLAAWTGLRVLNLSMGNVNPWETGPYQPGHLVLRSSMSCAQGCWACSGRGHACHAPFSARRVASLVERMLKPTPRLDRLSLPGLRLFSSGRSPDGLAHLTRLCGASDAHRLLGRFWHAFFGWRFGIFDRDRPALRFTELREENPRLAQRFLAHLPSLGRSLRDAMSAGLDDRFWRLSPPMLRPLTGYLLPLLQNGDFSPRAQAEALKTLEALVSASS